MKIFQNDFENIEHFDAWLTTMQVAKEYSSVYLYTLLCRVGELEFTYDGCILYPII